MSKKEDETLNQELLVQAKGWVHKHWISAKKLWYKKVILREEEFEDLTRKKSNKTKAADDDSYDINDFEYSFPEQDTYAYVW